MLYLFYSRSFMPEKNPPNFRLYTLGSTFGLYDFCTRRILGGHFVAVFLIQAPYTTKSQKLVDKNLAHPLVSLCMRYFCFSIQRNGDQNKFICIWIKWATHYYAAI